jgi:hypothetical protein
MTSSPSWTQAAVIIGLGAMIAGALDPMEGSLLILPGAGLVALGAWRRHSRHWRMVAWAFGLIAIGVALLFGMSAIGGFGGNTGRSMWWALLLLPYPAGWLLGLVGGVRVLRGPG